MIIHSTLYEKLMRNQNMRAVWVVIPLVLIGIIGIIGMQESFAEENSSIISKNDLEFSVMTDKIHYKDDEIIHIFWHVQNIGNSNVSYTTTSTCNDGFRWNVVDSDQYRVNGMLGEFTNIIKENDLTALKFENPGFYGEILQSIVDEPNKTRDILIFTSNGDELVNILKEKFDVVKHSEPRSVPDAIGARVSIKHIPKIANMELVTNIIQGDAPVCGSAELIKPLKPGEIINGNFSWSQLVHVKDNLPQHVPDGYYSIDVNFDNVSNCVIVGINANNTLFENISCGFGNVEDEIRSYTLEEALEIQRQRIDMANSNHNAEEIEYRYNESYPKQVTWETYMSPLKQTQVYRIVNPYGINCNSGLDLIVKKIDGLPACVKPDTAEKLILRDWAIP